jgi:hypothetical protein
MKKRWKVDWNARINWFDDWFRDWREWFGPKTYGIGYTAKTWKGAVAIGVIISAITIFTIVLKYYFS